MELAPKRGEAQPSPRAQYPLIKEYTLNHIEDPFIILGIFLGVLGSLGSAQTRQTPEAGIAE